MEPIIHTIINGIKGFAIQPFLSYIHLLLIAEFILLNKIKKVALVDLGPSDQIVDLIKTLINFGIEVVYIDHHENKEKNISNYHQIVDRLGKNARVLPGEFAPSATSMVEIGEWLKRKVDFVVFHDDLDGYLSYLKGCFDQKFYDQLDIDANKFEGQINSNGYSPLANIYLMGTFYGPSYFVNPVSRQENRQTLYEKLRVWIENGQNDEVISDYINIITAEYQQNKILTQNLFVNIKKEKGLVYVDILKEYQQGIKPNLGLLKAEMFRQGDNNSIVAIRLIGKLGDQISLFTPRRFQKHFKLFELLPNEEANDWHREDRLHIKSKNFEMIKKKIQKFY